MLGFRSVEIIAKMRIEMQSSTLRVLLRVGLNVFGLNRP